MPKICIAVMRRSCAIAQHKVIILTFILKPLEVGSRMRSWCYCFFRLLFVVAVVCVCSSEGWY
jgi:hypothetical protein